MAKGWLDKILCLFQFKSDSQMLKELSDSDLPKEVVVMLERQTLKFDVAHTLLLERFDIHVPSSKSFRKVCTYLRGGLTQEERVMMGKLFRGEHGRRKAYMFMVEMREITPSKLNNCFPLGERRNQFELWLDGKINQLP